MIEIFSLFFFIMWNITGFMSASRVIEHFDNGFMKFMLLCFCGPISVIFHYSFIWIMSIKNKILGECK